MSNELKKTPGRGHKAWLYAVSLVLVVFYILVLYLGLKPNVGIEYKMYYISHELSDWPGFGKLTYSLGTKEICTGYLDTDGHLFPYKVCARKGQGWNRWQYYGSSNNARESSIYYLLDEDSQSSSYTIEIVDYSGKGKVELYRGDQYLGEFSDKGIYTYEVGSLEKGELIKFTFKSDSDVEFRIWSAILDK